MSDELEVWKGEGENPVPELAYSNPKSPRGLPGLTTTSDRQIVVNQYICHRKKCTMKLFGI